MRRKTEEGQATIIVVIALSLFLLGGIGLAIDASHLYAHRQMAQAAADASAEAAMMSVFSGTNTSAYANAFGTSPFNCITGTDLRTPCAYARLNGFGLDANDIVSVQFPGEVPGVANLSLDDVPAVIKVIVTRTVGTSLMGFVGSSSAMVRAVAVVAILQTKSPVPIIVLHPTMPSAFTLNGSPILTVCGGPFRSVQVNSSSPTSIVVVGGSNVVDLSKAGPKNRSEERRVGKECRL